MPRICCVQCGQRMKLPSYVLRATICCPQCRMAFVYPYSMPAAPAPAPPPPEPAAATDAKPALTSPYQCSQCKQPIHQATGFTQTTLQCPSCHNRTSLYAVHYRCPSCGIPLESPSTYQGLGAVCPGCRSQIRVPRDVLQTKVPWPPDPCWFGFACPECEAPLVAKKEDVGTRVVCPSCRVTLDVPPLGYQLPESEPAPADPMKSLHETTYVRCPGCAHVIPKTAEECPYCEREMGIPGP